VVQNSITRGTGPVEKEEKCVFFIFPLIFFDVAVARMAPRTENYCARGLRETVAPDIRIGGASGARREERRGEKTSLYRALINL